MQWALCVQAPGPDGSLIAQALLMQLLPRDQPLCWACTYAECLSSRVCVCVYVHTCTCLCSAVGGMCACACTSAGPKVIARVCPCSLTRCCYHQVLLVQGTQDGSVAPYNKIKICQERRGWWGKERQDDNPGGPGTVNPRFISFPAKQQLSSC